MAIKTIHTRTIMQTISNYENKIVLNGESSPIHKSKLVLPRSARATLAQLRSGWRCLLTTTSKRSMIPSSILTTAAHNAEHHIIHNTCSTAVGTVQT